MLQYRKAESRWQCLIVLFCLLQFASASSVFAQKGTVWQIEQKHIVNGLSVIQCAPNALCIINKQHGWRVLSAAPDWKVHIFRTDDKIICTLSKEKFFAKQGYSPNPNWRAPYSRAPTRMFGNLKAEVLCDRDADSWACHLRGIPIAATDIVNACNKSRAVELLVIKKVSAPKKESAKNDSRAFTLVDDRGGGTILDTLSIREVPFKTSDFTLPKNLRDVADLKQIITSVDTRKEAESIFQQMGVGENLGNEKRK